MNHRVDCIIPFYNEGPRVLHVVKSILNVKYLSKIIVIDDGSNDRTSYMKLKADFPQITSIRLEKNGGKGGAVRKGLQYVSAKYVLLLDGDLTNIKLSELEKALITITSNPHIDMIILRRVDDITSNAWARQDIVTSGQRILKTEDLQEIFRTIFESYQLEVAINAYIMKNKKSAYWMPFSIHGPLRTQKWGWKRGMKQYYVALAGYFRYHLLCEFIRQTLFFCRNEAP
jgi:glycosyltransferase involved in cell wall biosynthesis